MKSIIKIALLMGLSFATLVAAAQMNPKVKLQDALKLIQDNYVDPVNDEHVVDAAIKAMLADLDPHSSYLSREEADAMNQSMTGSFAGIGIAFAVVNDSTFVTGINPDGPAARAGLKLGDQIIAIDGKEVFGRSVKNQDVMRMIRGEKGKPVELKVIRGSQGASPIHLTVMREQIAELSITASYMVDKNIGYIALSVFSQSTRREMDEALKNLKAQGMNKLILDLQGNGGGFVQAAIGVADEFLQKDRLVFYSVTNTGVKDNYLTGGFGQFMQGNLAVLIDESTASSSEIVTGALQDWDRAVVIGRRSFGKGIMQMPLQLKDGSLIRLTGARYYTPSDRSIQKPYGKGKTDYFQDFNRRMASGELKEGGHVDFPDSLKHKTVLNKRTVYGGGGIMPDRFVPIDTMLYSQWMSKTMNSGLVTKIAFDFAQRNREATRSAYKDFQSFKSNFELPTDLIDQVFDGAARLGIKTPPKTDLSARRVLSTELKAEVVAQLYEGRGYPLQVRNLGSDTFNTAVSILNDQKTYDRLLDNKPVGKGKNTKK